ncbi:hypothetical protein EJ08DRAFT_695638 [Tothia fuscella]|uniref:Uncharacterized protein n=1 Tax=Tothia fuscella TaxID=1048955 RepID=A0A9P4U001_9PEZI|nr:hypothetical protein EJ08DRAFT_695638 [Tothia fuscella]
MRAWEVEHLADIAWNDWKKRYDVIRAWFVLDYFDDTDLLEGENGVLRQDVERIQGELERLKGVIRRLEEDIRRAGRTVGEPEAESVGYQERQKLMWMEMVRSDEEVKAGETPKEKAKREKIEESEDNSWMNY